MSRVRDFKMSALEGCVSPRLKVSWEPGSGFRGWVWQFSIFLPRALLKMEGQESICTAADEDLLQELMEMHFGGCTSSPGYMRGIGRRGVYFETNLHRQITVLTSRWKGTRRYFKKLRAELEACSGEEQVLILRHRARVV